MKFGISNNVKSRVVRECTPELLRQALDSPLVARVCAEIEDALEAVRRGEMSKDDFETLKAARKKMLPVITPHATFRSGRRTNAEAVASGLSMYDVDHIPDPRGYYDEKVRGREAELGIVLAHVTPSTEGLRLLFVIPRVGMAPDEAQRWMSARLGDAAYDGAVKDLARCSFLVPREYVLYLDEERLFGNEELRMKNEEWPADGENSSFGGEADILHSSLPKFKGIPYSQIIQQWFKLAGGEPVPGERNDKLYRLASHLRYIADNDEALMLQVMPRYGLSEEEMKGLIHSACSAKWYSMPKMMQQALENEERRMKNEESTADGEDSSFGGEADILHSSLPKRLPALIKLLVSRTPDVYKPAVAHAVFPSLGAHLHRVRFKYIDNVEHEATLMNVLMAGTGAGKDCISEPINRIMADIRRRDEDNLRREREWKNEVTSKGANKDKRQRPEGLIIQEIDADMTNPAFVMRMAEADGHFLYTKLNEIDQFDALRGSGRGGQQFQIMCLAFDPGNRYGQTRVGAQSVTEKVTIRFNWNASTTIQKGRRYFSKVLTDGPISRINFCTIPEREIGTGLAPLWNLRRRFRRGTSPLHRKPRQGAGLDRLPAGLQARPKAQGRVCRLRPPLAEPCVRKPLVSCQRHRLPEGVRALRGERLPLGQDLRGLHPLVLAIRPGLQDGVLWRCHRSRHEHARTRPSQTRTPQLADPPARRLQLRPGHARASGSGARRQGHQPHAEPMEVARIHHNYHKSQLPKTKIQKRWN